ncbi:MAG: hypothetical protein WCQ54_13700 [Clostridiaceae bacterium]
MSEKAKLLKVIAIIASFTSLLCLMFIVTISVIDGFTIYPYIFLLISVMPLIYLWKLYIDEKKHNRK